MALEYNKKGKKSPNQKLLDKVNYSVKDKYGFSPTSILDGIPEGVWEDFLKEQLGNVDTVLLQDFKDSFEKVIDESVKKLEDKYNFIPKSIANCSINNDFKSFIDDSSIVKRVGQNGGVAKARGGGFASTYDYSTFNPALCEFLVKQYLTEGTTIFDPFAGRAVRALISNKNKINYHGWDVSPMTIKINSNKVTELSDEAHPYYNPDYDIVFNLGDGTKLDGVAKDFYDGGITSPPYGDIERYESAPGQLSDIKKYEDFLKIYQKGFERYYEVLKPTKSVDELHPLIFVTGNFRKDGKMIDFTHDTREAAYKAGFVLWDEIHHVNNSPFVYLRARQNEARKNVAKVHETVSVFVKLDNSIRRI